MASELTSKPSKLYLYNFPPVAHVYSVCPFAIKLESFCRINRISYETIYTTQFSSKWTMPYCRFFGSSCPETGEEVSDSNVIIERLTKEYQVTDSVVLSPMDRAITHTIIRMLEEHLAQIGFYYRYGLDMQNFVKQLDVGERWGNPEFCQRWAQMQPDATKAKTKKRGLTRHDDKDIWKFSNDDIQALSDILGDKKYFMGKDSPTLADCAVFGHLSQFLWIPIDFPQRKFMVEQCPNLVRFMETFRKEYWPDWEECCKKQPNQKYAAKKTVAVVAPGGGGGGEEKKE